MNNETGTAVATILRMMGGYLVRNAGTNPEPTTFNSRPCLVAAVRLACAIAEVDDAADLEIVDLATGVPADEDAICDILRLMESEGA